MTTDFFNIQRIEDDSMIVTILSTSMTSDYWSELEKYLRLQHARNKTIYFDFMVRNGLNDRFYKSRTDDNSSLVDELRKCSSTGLLLQAADTFFAEHEVYIERSVLTRSQKNVYFRRIKMR